jgi:hypothetical protein
VLKSFFDKNLIEAGCDEAGRGCLAGPVYASAVILPKNYKNKWLNDSKKLSDKDAEILFSKKGAYGGSGSEGIQDKLYRHLLSIYDL